METRDGSANMVQQMIHGTRYIDELVMVWVKNGGDLYVHQDANWNIIGVILESSSPTSRECCGATCGAHPQRRVKDRLVERYTYTPYGELTAHEEANFGDYDYDGDGDGDGDIAYRKQGCFGANSIRRFCNNPLGRRTGNPHVAVHDRGLSLESRKSTD